MTTLLRRALTLSVLLVVVSLGVVTSGAMARRSPHRAFAPPDTRTALTPVCASPLSPAAPSAVTAEASRARHFHVTNGFGRRMFGVAAGGDIQNETPSTMREDVADDARAGARWIRIDINWAQVQAAGPHSYDWTDIDRVLARARRCGIKVLGTIVFSPAWARPAGTSATHAPNPRRYARFAGVAARHLARRGVDAVEIWNEPNVSIFWEPRPNARAYTRMLRDAHRAIKRVDRRMTVVTGGMAPAATARRTIAPVRFLKEMYRDGAKGAFDAVGQHPYCWPAYPGARRAWSAWYQMYGTGHSLRGVMRAHGDGHKRIWGTEFGAPTYGPSGSSFVSLDTQAVMVARAYRLWASYRWAGPLFTYQGRDLGWRGNTIENFFGLIRYNFHPKPSFDSYRRDVLLVADSLRDTSRHRARRRR